MGSRADVIQELREAVIDPQQPYPARAGLRYDLTPYTLAKLEKLARAKFEIGRFNKAALRNIAETVNASSEIEGEEVPADKLDLALAAATRPSARRIDEDLEQRMLAVASIIRTLLWTLVDPPREFISFELVLENRDAYYEALFRAQQRWYQPDEDLTPWIEFYTDMVFNQYGRAFQRVKDARVRQR